MKKKNDKLTAPQIAVALIVAVVVLFVLSQQDVEVPVEEEPAEETVTEYRSSGGGGGGSTPPPPAPVVYDWCYQESPTVSNQTGIDGVCGLSYLGSFNTGNESFWVNYSNLNDGDWDSFAVANESVLPWAEISIAYEKPAGALPNSLFLHRHDNFYGNVSNPETIEFMQIPSTCWDYNDDYLFFTAVSRTNTSEVAFNYSAFHCYNGTHYPTMTSLTMYGRIYEDAMLWAFPEGYLEQFID